MAIYLNTGTPGAGKTLYTLWTVENRRIADNKKALDEWKEAGSDPLKPPLVRDVYFFNIAINQSKLPWIKLEKVDEWYKTPAGSIIVFDECQEAFPPRGVGSKIPEYVAELAKHRHRGYDLYFVTQHPSFVDPYVRKLPEQHNHLMRPYGAKRAIVHSFKGVRDNVDKTRKDSITSSFGYPKEVFTWYKSAEVHTHKLRIPWKIATVLLIPPLIGICGYYIYDYFKHKEDNLKKSIQKTTGVSDHSSSQKQDKTYVFQAADFKPRIDDLPWSAPRYDALTAPTIAPQLVGCMVFKGVCKCLTQQGTTQHVTMKFCLSTIENGIFNDFGIGDKKETEHQVKNDYRPPEQRQQIENVSRNTDTKPASTENYKPWTSRFYTDPVSITSR